MAIGQERVVHVKNYIFPHLLAFSPQDLNPIPSSSSPFSDHSLELMFIFSTIFVYLRSLIVPRIVLATEIAVLRQQLIVLNRTIKRPKLRRRDRLFCVSLSRLWKDWRELLVIVRPETVIKWHREGFRLYWRWKSKGQVGRPPINQEIQDLIRRMSRENPLWGLARIQSELRLLGFDVALRTIAKYRIKNSKPPSAEWTAQQIINRKPGKLFSPITQIKLQPSIFSLSRRSVSEICTASLFCCTSGGKLFTSMSRQIRAFPENEAPRYLLRDRDCIYAEYFQNRVEGMGIEQVVTAPRSPFQNPYAERVIGSIRRECLDHLIVLNEDHLRRILQAYFKYYHESRPHQSLVRNSPTPREIEPPSKGKVIALPQVGGLHHRYRRAA